MVKWSPNIRPEFLWKDFLASIVVFLTALPLCMGISLASGAPVEAGILTGIIGGLLVGFLSGSSFQVSGPAAGLSIIVLELIQAHGLAALGVVLMLAGVMQIVAGVVRTGQLFRAVSPAVVNGMLSGIGLLIVFSQIYVLIDSTPKGSGLKNIAELWPTLHSLMQPGSPHAWAGMLGVIGIVTMLGWKHLSPKQLQLVPSALVAVITVSVVALINQAPVHYVNVPSNILAAVHLPSWNAASHIGFWTLLEDAFALALIASAETLLSANAVDRLHNGPRTKYDRELIAQGIGNTLCGFLGCLPMTGVIARSSVNVQAGAKTRASTVLHGLWLLLFVSLLPNLLKMVPVSALAALLVVTGFRLIDFNSVRKLWDYGYRLVAIYAATVLCIVCTDLLTGVILGVVLSLAKLLYTMCRLDVTVEKDSNTARLTLQLQGAATFLSLPKLSHALEALPGNADVQICLNRLDYVDHACLELLTEWEKQQISTGGSLTLDWGELRDAFKYKNKRRFREQPVAQPAAVQPAARELAVMSEAI